MRVAIANRPPATEEQRARMSTARKLFMSDPSHRKMTSETTKRAMYRPEVQAKLHKTKTLSKEQREAYSVQGRINGKQNIKYLREYIQNNGVWNSGMTYTDKQRRELADTFREYFEIKYKEETLYVSCSQTLRLSTWIRFNLSIPVGRNKLMQMLKTQETYLGFTIKKIIPSNTQEEFISIPFNYSSPVDIYKIYLYMEDSKGNVFYLSCANVKQLTEWVNNNYTFVGIKRIRRMLKGGTSEGDLVLLRYMTYKEAFKNIDLIVDITGE